MARAGPADEAQEEALAEESHELPKSSQTRTAHVDATTQATLEDEQFDISTWDIKRVGKYLRRPQSLESLRATLRRLHVKWWHASGARMKKLLAQAGLPERVYSEVDNVVKTCRVCRELAGPNPKPKTASRLSTTFNATLQADIVFLSGKPVLHLIDEASRFTQAKFLEATDDNTTMAMLLDIWIRPFGPPSVLLSDQESGLKSDWIGTQLGRYGISRVLLPERMHASVVERHHSILREVYCKIKTQLESDGVVCDNNMILAEACFAKNCLTTVAGHCPYEAVLGKVPPMLPSNFEDSAIETLGDDNSTPIGASTKLRETALAAMVQSFAQDRIRRAEQAQSRQSVQQLHLSTGDLVDFWRTPIGKERAGWRGPATLVDCHTAAESGILHVKWQGRVLSVAAVDVRPHMVLYAWLTMESSAHRLIVGHVEALHNEIQFVGLVATSDRSWTLSNLTRRHPDLWDTLQELSLHGFGFPLLRALLGHGVRKIPGHGYGKSILICWIPGLAEKHLEFEVAHGNQKLMDQLLGEQWAHYCWIELIPLELDL
eukprot:6491860-Amphidinium_carterae.1